MTPLQTQESPGRPRRQGSCPLRHHSDPLMSGQQESVEAARYHVRIRLSPLRAFEVEAHDLWVRLLIRRKEKVSAGEVGTRVTADVRLRCCCCGLVGLLAQALAQTKLCPLAAVACKARSPSEADQEVLVSRRIDQARDRDTSHLTRLALLQRVQESPWSDCEIDPHFVFYPHSHREVGGAGDYDHARRKSSEEDHYIVDRAARVAAAVAGAVKRDGREEGACLVGENETAQPAEEGG